MNSLTLPSVPFYFIRHGETEWNRRNIIMGSQDIPLNEHGLQQAHEASSLMEKESFDIIVSSPRLRALKTAEIIAQKTGKPIVLEEGLVERVWGEAEGTPFDPSKSLFDDSHKPQGAESFATFQERVLKAIVPLLAMQKLPLIVSHGGVFKALTHHMGYATLSSANCTPFFFRPPDKDWAAWSVYPLEGEEI